MKRVLLALAALSVSGCSTTLPPHVSLKGRKLLVIPFPQGPARESESTLGRGLAAGICASTAAKLPKGAAVLDFREAERLMPHGPSVPVDWARLGTAMKADVLLLGEIKDYRLKDPKSL